MYKSEMTKFRSSLRQMERFLVNSLKVDGECCGITFNECHIIMEIFEKREVVMKELANTLLMDKSIISRSVEMMVKSGLILRKEDSEDRRKKNLILTETGEKKAEEINSLMNVKYEKLLNCLPGHEEEKIIEAARLLADTFDKWKVNDPGCCKAWSQTSSLLGYAAKGEINGCCQ